jgi:hypothetical protein
VVKYLPLAGFLCIKPLLCSLFFFASPKKNQKKSPTKDYIAFVGWFPDLAFVLL